MSLISFNVILVRPLYPKNLGSCARAVGNMGGARLIFLDPQCQVDFQAREAAAGAQSWLETAITYSSWSELNQHEDQGPRIGFTRRQGQSRQVALLSDRLKSLQNDYQRVAFNSLYLVFGPEDDGLNANDLLQVNHACSLKTFGDFASLNLSHAVLLALFVAQNELSQMTYSENSTQITDEHRTGSFDYLPDQLIQDWITSIGFDIKARKSSAFLTLKRLFNMKNPTKHELQVLQAVLYQTVRKLNQKNNPVI